MAGERLHAAGMPMIEVVQRSDGRCDARVTLMKLRLQREFDLLSGNLGKTVFNWLSLLMLATRAVILYLEPPVADPMPEVPMGMAGRPSRPSSVRRETDHQAHCHGYLCDEIFAFVFFAQKARRLHRPPK